MIRSLDKYISVEMFSLWLVEFVLVAVVTCFMLTIQPGSISGSWERMPVVATGACVLAITISTVSVAIGLYRPEICLKAGRFFANTLVVGFLAFLAISMLNASRLFDFGQHQGNAWINAGVVETLVGWVACLFVTRIAFNAALRRNVFARRIVVVGSSWAAGRIQDIISADGAGFCKLAGTVDVGALRTPADLRRDKVWAVVFDGEHGPAIEAAERADYERQGILMLDEAAFRELRLQSLDIDRLPDDWMSTIHARRGDAVHRVLDVVLSLTLLIVTLPIMVMTAIAIKCDSRGSVFYGQERVGLNGRPFTLWKFRSMSTNAEALGKPVWAVENDPRVTHVGRFIRRSRIDELPQILNVLGGAMSFIGPRPERPVFVEHLAQSIPRYNDRACVKPGITGWAQVNFPYGASIDDARKKLSYDLYYVKHRSIVLSLLIVVATVRVILFQEGSR